MASPTVTVTVQFQSRKSEFEIESIVKKTDLCRIAIDWLCCTERDVILKQYDEELRKWEEITSEELTVEEGMKFKLKKECVTQDLGEDFDSSENFDQDEMCSLPGLFTTSDDSTQDIECDSYGAYLPTNTLWKGEGGQMKKELKVYFFEDKDNVLKYLHYYYKPLTPDVVMEIVNKYWKLEGEDEKYIPKFVHVHENCADVRVEFRNFGCCWSKLGTEAQVVKIDEPTVVFNFKKMDNYCIRATIIYEFGRVLGLGSEHQHPQYWQYIKKFLDLNMMKKSLKVNVQHFSSQWTNSEPDQNAIMSDYDEDSVMHSHTKLFWLDRKYRLKEELKPLREKNEITEEEYKALKGFHKHIDFVRDTPSKTDRRKLAEAYRDLFEQLQS